jgi:hypothetical protein
MSDTFVRLLSGPNVPGAVAFKRKVTLVVLFASTLFVFSFFSLLKKREKVSLLSLRPYPLQVGRLKSVTLLSPKYHLFRISFFISTNNRGAGAWAV